MAAAFRCADFISPSTLLPSYSAGKRISFKIIRCCSSTSIPLSSKSLKRKNYLRPKILRTLNPNPEEAAVLIGVDSTEKFLISYEDDVVEDELQVSSSSIESNEFKGIVSKLSPKLVAKYGLYLIGIFAFQTVCAVLFLGDSTKSDKTPGVSSSSLSSDMVLVEDLEMNEKIAEIRAMAREARKSEEKSGNKEEDDENLNPDIEKEIEARLSSMEKRLNSQRKGLAGLRVDDLKHERSFVFEKKYKFKAEKPSTGDVKGFGGSKGENELIPGTLRDDKGKLGKNGEMNPEDRQNETESYSGAALESEQRRPSVDVNKSTKSGSLGSHKPKKEAGTGFGRSLLSGKHGEVRKGKPMRRAKEKQSGEENNIWWLKLPYVLRILMRSNIGEEITEGYFTIKTKSLEENKGEVSHIVAFEDQNDARNLSYLLESFFEDLDDFSANVVPVSTKDLLNEVGSGGKNVIVVKKSRLKLYAGQPFEDVERALHDLIQEQQ